jgi:hypothetical protein
MYSNRIKHIYPLLFISQTLIFSNPHILFFARLYGVQGRSRWPADPRATLACLSSDGVPPELEFLGLHEFLLESGQTGFRNRSDRFARGAQELAVVTAVLRV